MGCCALLIVVSVLGVSVTREMAGYEGSSILEISFLGVG